MTTGEFYVPPQRIAVKTLKASDVSGARALVDSAIAAFDLDSYSIASLVQHSNLTAHLVSVDDPPLALRLRTNTPVDARTEFEWLRAVRHETSINVLEPYAEEFLDNHRVIVSPAGATTECGLFRWVEGRPLAAELTRANYHELGRITARLHEFASTWAPPAGLRPLVWDRTMYYEGTTLLISDPRFAKYISRSEARTIEEVVTAADDELLRLAGGPRPIFLHGNIEMWNVLITASGELTLLDFEDVMFGDPVLDVAITLFYGRERPDHAALSAAYESGYRSVRDWPVATSRQMDLLFAARAAMLLNHALETEVDKRDVSDRLLPVILAAAA